ncbi:hypothetical protein [Microbispora sp. NBC_01389]|uniref:hypothetical protein n=1 Tax=Microbispora sp. NBC_01389 TaxID=2903584 RepID=UPI00325160D8
MCSRLLPAGSLAVAVATALLAGGCGSGDDWSRPHAKPTAVGHPGPGFLPATSLAPEATITPRPGSWNAVRPSDGYRVVLLIVGEGHQTRTLVNAVTEWAEGEHVSLKTITATKPAGVPSGPVSPP